MYHVYIIQSQKDKSYYTGFTENLEERLKDHDWFGSTYSKTKAPFELIWFCSFKDKKKAIDFEKYLKQGSGLPLDASLKKLSDSLVVNHNLKDSVGSFWLDESSVHLQPS